MDKTIVARWQDWSGDGVQHLVVRMRSDSIVAEGVVLTAADRIHFAATYRVECDASWRARVITVRLIGVEGRGIDLTSDGAGHWHDVRGVSVPQLDGAIDVDISVTPFTNTLPIRRLDLAESATADVRAVYIHLPDLTVTVDPQRYTCLKRGQRYRYESLDTDFVRDIDVDADGLVVTYPGLFRRVLFPIRNVKRELPDAFPTG
jgi:hypothetical protein